jgi:ATP-binding cassette subfamily F protein 3
MEGNVSLERGHAYGCVGRNGAGKTSLARVLSSSANIMPSTLVVEYLCSQQTEDTKLVHDWKSMTPMEYCMARAQCRAQETEQYIQHLEVQLEELSVSNEEQVERLSTEIGELYDLQEDLMRNAEVEAQRALKNLGFEEAGYLEMPLECLSEGWRYKCKLAACLGVKADLLIVDEPSFLDKRSTEWLVEALARAAKQDNSIVVLISHKEALLEAVADRILFINAASKQLSVYHCPYEVFRSTVEEQTGSARRKLELTSKETAKSQASLDSIQKNLRRREKNLKKLTTQNADKRFIKGKNIECKQKADKSAAAKVKQLKKQADDMVDLKRASRQEKKIELKLKGSRVEGISDGQPIVSLNEVSFAYDDANGNILEYINAQIMNGDRILLEGRNGEGKTTLVRLIAGEVNATGGNMKKLPAVQIAYFPQTALSDMVRQYGSHTAVEFLHHLHPSLSETENRNHLGRFGIKGSMVSRPLASLSSGQRVRLWLAQEFLSEQEPSLLIVDEISENLDVDTMRSLLDCLQAFRGAILAISHDEFFCEEYHPSQIWTISNGYLRSQAVDNIE